MYKALLEELGEIIRKPVLREADFDELTLLSLRAAYVADVGVLVQLKNFAETLKEAVVPPASPSDQKNDEEPVEEDMDDDSSRNRQITRAERQLILVAFSHVSRRIRKDLIDNEIEEDVIWEIIRNFTLAGKIADATADTVSTPVSTAETTTNDIAVEAGRVEDGAAPPAVIGKKPVVKMTQEQFLEKCTGEGEREFFEAFLPLLEQNRFVPLWTQKGFSIEKTIRFFPSEKESPNSVTNWRSYIDRPALAKRRGNVQEKLVAVGVNKVFEDKKADLRFDWNDMKNATPDGFLEVVKAVLR